MREILNEFLRPQSPLWPEVKLFLSICKSAGQRLPMEVQVVNIMNVRRGLKRLIRLKGNEDPLDIQALLRWITERSEIAGAFCLQRLKIGHQVRDTYTASRAGKARSGWSQRCLAELTSTFFSWISSRRRTCRRDYYFGSTRTTQYSIEGEKFAAKTGSRLGTELRS